MTKIEYDENCLINAISLGGGVQSTVMTLMADKGMFGVIPDAAVFADTQWEPQEVYDNIEWLRKQVSIPIYITTVGNLREDLIKYRNILGVKGFSDVPVYVFNNDKYTMSSRQCTGKYKVRPVIAKIREIAGLKYKQRTPKGKYIAQWIGISMDEYMRVKESDVSTLKNVYPLIDSVPKTRAQCLQWFNENYPGVPLGKSSCLGCPYKGKSQWMEMYNSNKDYWNDVVEVDNAIRDQDSSGNKVFLSRNGPLKDLPKKIESEPRMDLLVEECEGYCWT